MEWALPPERFADADYRDLGDFTLQPFQAGWRHDEAGLLVTLTRHGHLQTDAGPVPATVRKALRLPRGRAELHVEYTVALEGAAPPGVLFASEWNLNLLGGGGNPAAYYLLPNSRGGRRAAMDSRGEAVEVRRLALVNEGLGVRLRLECHPPARLWRFPVESLSSSEGGLERVYQGSCVALLYPLPTASGEPLTVRLTWRAE